MCLAYQNTFKGHCDGDPFEFYIFKVPSFFVKLLAFLEEIESSRSAAAAMMVRTFCWIVFVPHILLCTASLLCQLQLSC